MNRYEYEADVIKAITTPFRRAPAISDETQDAEHHALDIVIKAYAAFRSSMQDAAALSDLRRDQIEEALKYLGDLMPDALAWEEQINAEKMGY